MRDSHGRHAHGFVDVDGDGTPDVLLVDVDGDGTVSFDDFAAAGTDEAANRRMLGIG